MEQQAGNFSSSLESLRPPGMNLFCSVVRYIYCIVLRTEKPHDRHTAHPRSATHCKRIHY